MSNPETLSQSSLAKAWDTSRQYVYKLVKQGMPLTSLDEANKWRAAHQRRAVVTTPKPAKEPKVEPVAAAVSPEATPARVTTADVADWPAEKKKASPEKKAASTKPPRAVEALEAGFKLEVERLSKACADANARMQTAAPEERYQAVREYALLTDTWRKLAKDAPEIEKLAGDSFDRVEVEKFVGAAFTAIAGALDALPNRVGPLLHGRDVVTIIEALKDEVATVKRNLEGALGK